MMTKWTIEQQTAIDTRGADILVSAAAGSGKTSVMVERIFTLICCERADIERMLVITFTKAAAASMRRKIADKLYKAGQDKTLNQELRQYLKRQYLASSRAQIKTVHSFCESVVREHFSTIGVDPGLRVADEAETELLRTAAMDKAFEQGYTQVGEPFEEMVEQLMTGKRDDGVRQFLLKLYIFMRSRPKPLAWLEQAVNMYSDKPDGSIWLKEMEKHTRFWLTAAQKIYGYALSRAELLDDKYVNILKSDLNKIESAEKLTQTEFFRAVSAIDFDRFPTKTKNDDEAEHKNIKTQRESVKKLINGLISQLHTLEGAQEHTAAAAPFAREIYNIMLRFDSIYSEMKADKGLQDFDDLEQFALRILEDNTARSQIQQQYDYVFVDEYQDINDVQESIIQAVRRENNLFLVGDIKQSIYGFRHANPGLFAGKMNKYAEGCGCRVDLNSNFRSAANILEAANYVFRAIMSPELGAVAYDDSAALRHGATWQEKDCPQVELLLYDKTSQRSYEAREQEAYAVAKRLKELYGTQIYDKEQGVYRSADYRDMVILLRAAAGCADVYHKKLTELGIPALLDTEEGFFASREVDVMLALLKLLDNRRQDIPLLTVLRSEIGGFTDEELARIRINTPTGPFHAAAAAYTQLSDTTAEHISALYRQLDTWAFMACFAPLDRLIERIYDETGLLEYSSCLPGGAQRAANLRMLTDYAAAFQAGGLHGIYSFLGYVERLRESNKDIGSARTAFEDDVVRITTIHKSKGLEYPVVVLADLGREFNIKNTGRLFHDELGLGLYYTSPERVRYKTIGQTVIDMSLAHAAKEEEMRILYVGMTRAVNKLILSGSFSPDDDPHKWGRVLSPYILADTKSLLTWVCSALLRHQDAGNLRALYGQPVDLMPDNSCWDIKILSYTQPQAAEEISEKSPADFLIGTSAYEDERFVRQLEQAFGWEYPYASEVLRPSKLAVTELDAPRQTEPDVLLQPSFSAERELTPADRGKILHYIMLNIDLAHCQDKAQAEQQLENLIARGFITRQEAEAVDTDRIVAMTCSPLGRRMQQAQLRREIPFNILLPAEEFAPLQAKGDVFVQGIIDCFFIEDGEVVLVDYKTDRISGTPEATALRHKKQMDVYAYAIKAITGLPVKQRFIYLFGADLSVEI